MHWEAEECRRCSKPKKCGKGEHGEERALGIRKECRLPPGIHEKAEQKSMVRGNELMPCSAWSAPNKLLNPDKSYICDI